ncbi:MAG: iron-sulfur cluster assembly protein [Ferruginibacter sp.]
MQNVMAPEIGLKIVDLGLVYQVDFDEHENTIFVSMTLTTQFCPMG